MHINARIQSAIAYPVNPAQLPTMTKPHQNPIRNSTLQFRAYTAKAGYAAITHTLPLLGELQNLLIQQRRYMAGGYRHGREKLRHQNASLTDLRNNDHRFTPLARKILEGVARRVNKAWRRAYSDPDTSFPKTRSPYDFQTIEISEPKVQHLKFSASGTAEIHIKGLPTIRFYPDHRLPRNRQPRSIMLTRRGRKLTVSLTYNLLPLEYTPPKRKSCGADMGVANRVTLVNEHQQYTEIPPVHTREHRKKLRRIKRAMQRCRDAAINDQCARWVNQKLPNGKTKRRFRWNQKPSRQYLDLRAQLQNVEHKRTVSLRNADHRITSAIVKQHALIAVEDLHILNMSKSASGTLDNPGTRVAQKRGLNREILAQRWGNLRRQLDYKAHWHSRHFIAVPARNTSRTCPNCGHIAKANRVSRDRFQCQQCPFGYKSDVIAGENIRCLGVKAQAGAGDFAPVNHRSRKASSRPRATRAAYAAQPALLLFTKIPATYQQ